MTKNPPNSPTVHNRKAAYEYHILETYECGIILKGTEIKAIREGKLDISEAYAVVQNNELILMNSYVEEYSHGGMNAHKVRAQRKLLAHKKEIIKLKESSEVVGYTLVPTSAYFKNGKLKVAISVCKGKDHRDKRQDKAKKDAKREMDRALKGD